MVDFGKGVLMESAHQKKLIALRQTIKKSVHQRKLKDLKKLVQQYFLIINKAMKIGRAHV